MRELLLRSPFAGEPLAADDAERLAEVFKVLADQARLRIISVLACREDATGSELAPLVGASQATVSHHLGRLRRAGLTSSRQDGPSVPHRLEWGVLASVADALRPGVGVR